MKIEELYKQIISLSDRYENRDLEEYLLALYRLVEEHKEEKMTNELFFELISQAFVGDPAEFREEWLACEESPDINAINRKFTNPEFKDEVDKSIVSTKEGIDYTREVLKFQIAELHKMRGKQLENQYRFFGIDSETGNIWYNFDPFANLECGAACILDNSGEESEEITVKWETLGELLEDGRIYE